MTTAEKMRFFQENADARKAAAIENNSFYGENIPQAQESLKMDKSLRSKSDPNAHLKNKAYLDYQDAQDPSMNRKKSKQDLEPNIEYYGAKTAEDSNAVRHAYDVNNPGSFPGTAKAGVTTNPFYKKAMQNKNKRN